jgi:hypothetical protein
MQHSPSVWSLPVSGLGGLHQESDGSDTMSEGEHGEHGARPLLRSASARHWRTEPHIRAATALQRTPDHVALRLAHTRSVTFRASPASPQEDDLDLHSPPSTPMSPVLVRGSLTARSRSNARLRSYPTLFSTENLRLAAGGLGMHRRESVADFSGSDNLRCCRSLSIVWVGCLMRVAARTARRAVTVWTPRGGRSGTWSASTRPSRPPSRRCMPPASPTHCRLCAPPSLSPPRTVRD